MTVSKPHRLYAKARINGFTRGKRNQKTITSLVTIEGVNTIENSKFYLGKRIAYVYRAKKTVDNSNIRVIWGRVTRSHGNSGVVRAKFAKNLPARAMGASARVFLYPSRV